MISFCFLSSCNLSVDTLESFVISSLGDPDAMLNHKLLVAAMLMERIRKEIKEKTQFSCSAGISYNKILAKLACGINKPNRQTIVPPDRVAALFRTTPIGKCRSLGGKLGSLLQEKLQISTMAELSCVSFDRLLSICDRKTAEWLNELAKGVERTPVVPHQLPKSIGSSKNFFGTSALKTSSDIFFWLTQLAAELFERLEEDRQKHQRLAASLTVGLRYAGTATVSRVIPIASYEVEKIAQLAFKCLQQFNRSSAESSEWTPPVNNLSLSASRFTLGSITDSTTITSFFRHKNKVAPEPECPSAISHSKKAKNDASTSSESSGNVADRSNCGRSIRTRDRKSMDRPAMSVNSFFIPQDIQQLPSDSLSERELLTGKKIEPEHSVTSSQLSGAHWVQLESSYVDEEVWKELPPDIRWELK